MRQYPTVIRLLAATSALAWFAYSPWTVTAQDPKGRSLDIPWPADQGAGQLTDPGHSRLLPAPAIEDAPPASEHLRRITASDPVRPSAGPPSRSPRRDESANDWWNEAAEPAVVDTDRGRQARGISPRGEIIASTQILSMVGSEPILAGDLLGRINELLKDAEGQIPKDELDKQRWLLMERMLPSAIEAKLVYLDFIRSLPKEQIDMIRMSVFEQFDEKQLPTMVESAKLQSTAELDAKMRSFGSSLDAVRRNFFEQVASREMVRKHGADEREVTHDDLLAYYQDHLSDYEFAAQARWERLMVVISKYGSKPDARKALAEMGNAVLRGAPFESVARRGSDGPRAQHGGSYDWTQQGSLASKPLDKAIFTLPVGAMSDIIEDDFGLHIIRVVERKNAGRVSFVEAQVEIREKINELRREEKIKAYLERLKRQTYVWNYFSEQARIAERSRDQR